MFRFVYNYRCPATNVAHVVFGKTKFLLLLGVKTVNYSILFYVFFVYSDITQWRITLSIYVYLYVFVDILNWNCCVVLKKIVEIRTYLSVVFFFFSIVLWSSVILPWLFNRIKRKIGCGKLIFYYDLIVGENLENVGFNIIVFGRESNNFF